MAEHLVEVNEQTEAGFNLRRMDNQDACHLHGMTSSGHWNGIFTCAYTFLLFNVKSISRPRIMNQHCILNKFYLLFYFFVLFCFFQALS